MAQSCSSLPNVNLSGLISRRRDTTTVFVPSILDFGASNGARLLLPGIAGFEPCNNNVHAPQSLFGLMLVLARHGQGIGLYDQSWIGGNGYQKLYAV